MSGKFVYVRKHSSCAKNNNANNRVWLGCVPSQLHFASSKSPPSRSNSGLAVVPTLSLNHWRTGPSSFTADLIRRKPKQAPTTIEKIIKLNKDYHRWTERIAYRRHGVKLAGDESIMHRLLTLNQSYNQTQSSFKAGAPMMGASNQLFMESQQSVEGDRSLETTSRASALLELNQSFVEAHQSSERGQLLAASDSRVSPLLALNRSYTRSQHSSSIQGPILASSPSQVAGLMALNQLCNEAHNSSEQGRSLRLLALNQSYTQAQQSLELGGPLTTSGSRLYSLLSLNRSYTRAHVSQQASNHLAGAEAHVGRLLALNQAYHQTQQLYEVGRPLVGQYHMANLLVLNHAFIQAQESAAQVSRGVSLLGSR